MLGDVASRPYSYGRNKEKFLDPTLFYEKFKIRYDLTVSDQEIEEYTDLLSILIEMINDDHADELRRDTNWEETDVDHNRLEEAYFESEKHEKTDYIRLLRPLEQENRDLPA